MPLRSQGYCGFGRGLSGLLWVWCNGSGPHLELRQEPQGSAPDFLEAGCDSDRRVPVEFAQECQVSCSAEEWNSAYISSCSRMTPLFVMCVEPAGFSEMHGGVSAPSCCAFIHRVAFEELSGHRDLLKCGPGNRGLSACCTTHEATSRISSGGRPHPEARRKVREPFPNKAGESTLLSGSGGEKGLR